jgi:hypothetical protein
MMDSTMGLLEDLRQSWSRVVTSYVRGQWLLAHTGFQITQAMLRAGQSVGGGTAPLGTNELLSLASARMKQGLAPPREVYLAPYRDQIDWTQCPAWARPSDPDLFEGCTHEG